MTTINLTKFEKKIRQKLFRCGQHLWMLPSHYWCSYKTSHQDGCI